MDEKKSISNYLLLKKGKYQLIKGFKIQIQDFKKEKIILDIETLIEIINKKDLIIGLLSLEKFKQKALIFSYEELELNKVIDKIAKELFEKNVIIFKLDLYMPKLYEFTIEELIVWINKVEVKQDKLKKDNKKQFFNLIYEYQNVIEIEKKQLFLLKILKKIQKYIKYARY